MNLTSDEIKDLSETKKLDLLKSLKEQKKNEDKKFLEKIKEVRKCIFHPNKKPGQQKKKDNETQKIQERRKKQMDYYYKRKALLANGSLKDSKNEKKSESPQNLTPSPDPPKK